MHITKQRKNKLHSHVISLHNSQLLYETVESLAKICDVENPKSAAVR